MKWSRCKQIAVFTVTVMAIALLAPRAPAAPNSPPGPSVTVVNTQTNPVPVSVLNFPSGTNTVQVSSSTNAPVFVQAVPRHVFAEARGVTLTNSQAFSGEANLLTPPPGKRVVIETVSVFAELPTGQTPLASIRAGGVAYSLLLTRQGPGSGAKDFYVGTFPIRLYSQGAVLVSLGRDPDAGDALAIFASAGYFEDAP
jgi:hypothetical protein